MRPPPPTGRRRPRRTPAGILNSQDGIALVLTLLVVTLLTAMIIDFDYRTRLDVRAAANFRDAARAELLAESGVEVVKGLLRYDLEVPGGATYDGYDEIWASFNNAPPMAIPDLPDAQVSLKVEDEGGKFDLNSLIKDGNDDPERTPVYKRLIDQILSGDELPSPDDYDGDELVDSLMDWLDADSQPRSRGAEDPHYRSLDPPYTCANGPLHTIDELRLVNGYDDAMVKELRKHVTVIWSGDKQLSGQLAAKPRKMNLNTMSPELLGSLDPQFDIDAARDVVGYIRGAGDPHHAENTTWQGLQSFSNEFSVEQTAQRMTKFLQPRSDMFSAHITVEIVGQGASGTQEARTRRSVSVMLHRVSSGKNAFDVLGWRAE